LRQNQTSSPTPPGAANGRATGLLPPCPGFGHIRALTKIWTFGGKPATTSVVIDASQIVASGAALPPAAKVDGALAEPAALQRARGEGRLQVSLRDGHTRIAGLYQDGCAKIRLPNTHHRGLQAVLMNTAGGLTGGDHIRWSATAAPGTRLALTTPACERIYRSLGGDALVETRLVADAGAHVDWLPQETILFEAARLDRRLDIDLAEDATLTAVEAVLLGREAMGESAATARLRDNWRIRRNGRLLHAEATELRGDPHERSAASLLDGARAFATVLHVSPLAERRLSAVRALLPARGGASVVGDRLTVRLLAASGLALRRSLSPIIALLADAGGLPRLWSL
jgi:urease accessory protein